MDAEAVATVFLAFAVLMLVGVAVPRGKYVLVVGWPGTSEARMMKIIADAGGSYVQKGGRNWLAVVKSDRPDLSMSLMREGALLVLDHGLAVGCTEGN